MAGTHTAGNAVIGVSCRLVTCVHTATDAIVLKKWHVAITRVATGREERGRSAVRIAAGTATNAGIAISAVAPWSTVAAVDTLEAASIERPPFLQVGITIAIVLTSAIAVAITSATIRNDRLLLSATRMLRWLLTQGIDQR